MLFDLPKLPTKEDDKALVAKAGKKAKGTAVTSRGNSLLDKIGTAVALVQSHLGAYENEYITIRDEQVLVTYIDKCIKNGYITLDTETTGLDPMRDKIVGFSLYTQDMKPAYIPVAHIDYITQVMVKKQLSMSFVLEQVQRLHDAKVKIIMFNAKFDIRVMQQNFGIKLECYFDCSVASRLLNENEPFNGRGLKKLHEKYCGNSSKQGFSFDELFDDIPFNMVPIKPGSLYGAHDAIITWELYQFQLPFLDLESPVCQKKELQGVANVFWNIEMPLIPVIAEMENTGIQLDLAYIAKIKEEYEAEMEKATKKFHELCKEYADIINTYRLMSVSSKGVTVPDIVNGGVRVMQKSDNIDDPVNVGSPKQIAVLLYDIIGIQCKTRGTGEEILSTFDHSIAKIVLEYRGIQKLISTYIDKMAEIVNPKTGRVHASFNQLGTDTGRFSSKEPNMQNIPSHDIKIRPMFTATEGYYLISADYS